MTAIMSRPVVPEKTTSGGVRASYTGQLSSAFGGLSKMDSRDTSLSSWSRLTGHTRYSGSICATQFWTILPSTSCMPTSRMACGIMVVRFKTNLRYKIKDLHLHITSTLYFSAHLGADNVEFLLQTLGCLMVCVIRRRRLARRSHPPTA